MEPGQPVLTGNGDDFSITAVDDTHAFSQRALLGERISVMGGYTRITTGTSNSGCGTNDHGWKRGIGHVSSITTVGLTLLAVSTTTPPVLAVLRPGTGPELSPLDQPLLRADDFGITHGDGAFETMQIRPDGAWLLGAHLERLTGSAAALGLSLPPRKQLEDVVATAINGWHERGTSGHAADEAGVKLICSRGPEYAPELGPTVYALAFAVSDKLIAQRRAGVGVISLSFGYPAAERARAPWLLSGSKTLSYAVNMAALRHASLGGFDDVLLTSSDGYVLEGPTSTLVWAVDDVLHTVSVDTGILASVTVKYLLENAHHVGLRTRQRMVTPTQLHNTDGVWLCSSLRGIAEVTSLDGVKLPGSPLTARLRQLLGFPPGK
jgi:4-amino-4-deoxychorismate lyase